MDMDIILIDSAPVQPKGNTTNNNRAIEPLSFPRDSFWSTGTNEKIKIFTKLQLLHRLIMVLG